jgi:hypothetical protein
MNMPDEKPTEKGTTGTQSPDPTSASQKIIETLSVVRVRVVDAREPFPVLAQLGLGAVPNIGDLLNIQTSTGLKGYRVEFRNFNPFEEFQVTLGCLPFNTPTLNMGSIASNQERMDELIKFNIQFFEKAQAYANALILAGYAGLFTLWSFAQKNLTHRQIDVVAIMLGLSLMLFVSWEIYSMTFSATSYSRFVEIIDESPEKFFARFDSYQRELRLRTKKYRRRWAFCFYPTLVFGYGAAVLLLYNIIANLLGWPQWP